MTRRPAFWLGFTAVGVGGAIAAVLLFSRTFPIVTIDVAMDRARAMAEAEAIADRAAWRPSNPRSAASFGQVDTQVQAYIELEGGGRDAFVSLPARDLYHPYVWSVRLFQERVVEEAHVRFTPAGERYGFRMRLAEDDPGTGNLDAVAARQAAAAAAAEWRVDLTEYVELESSQETLPGGRLDHTLVYERAGVRVGEARFRLRLVVAGSQASEVTHFVHVPEGFSQRYAEMRSANNAISLAAEGVLLLLFVFVGAGVGTTLLLRQRWLVWRMPLAWGVAVSVLMALWIANRVPLSWMGYDTAVSERIFVLGQLGTAAAAAVLGAPLLAFCFMAAESLGRRAFPEHLQQWRFWSPDVAASTPALGRTIGAYLLAGAELGYVVLFYMTTSRLEGWWSPAEALVDPDLLATFQPWLQAVSLSTFAALWEESLFRAVPIASAALIGARYGRRSAWIWGVITLQALVFAAGHASYPQQPSYVRVIELFPTAFLWGVVYVRFGLVPTILAHFLYDLSLMSLPLFASTAPGIWLDRSVVLGVAALPLVIVLRARSRGRASKLAPEAAYNRAWRPARGVHPVASPEGTPAAVAGPSPPESAGAPRTAPRAVPIPRRVIAALGAAGVMAWTLTTASLAPSPGLTESRRDAISAAVTELDNRGIETGSLSAVASVTSGRDLAHSYVFEEGGPERYDGLVGSYLGIPRWRVRFVDWDASAEERVEEYRVPVGDAGEIGSLRHILPEARAGESLPEDGARMVALEHLRLRYALRPTDLIEIGAEEAVRPNRTDWTFTFSDPERLRGLDGDARVVVEIAGSEVVNTGRFVNVPQEWERDRRQRTSRADLITLGLRLLLSLALGAACVRAVVIWAKGSLDRGALARKSLVAGAALAVGGLNRWPGVAASFGTADAWALQAATFAFGITLTTLLIGTGVGLAAGLAHTWLGAGETRGDSEQLWPAIALGAALVGLRSATEWVSAGLPPWENPAGASNLLAVVSEPISVVVPYLLITIGILLLSGFYDRFGDRTVGRALLGLIVLALGVLMTPAGLRDPLWAWVLGAAGASGVVYLLVRIGVAAPPWVPVIMVVPMIADSLEHSLSGVYPGSTLGGLFAVVVLAGLARTWTGMLRRTTAPLHRARVPS